KPTDANHCHSDANHCHPPEFGYRFKNVIISLKLKTKNNIQTTEYMEIVNIEARTFEAMATRFEQFAQRMDSL
ncbi:hypothetical protein EZS27_036148, partial [termite gut metagenome]